MTRLFGAFTIFGVLALHSACSTPLTLLIENTSGYTKHVHIAGPRDVFLDDSLPQGASLCWQVPDAARGVTLSLSVSTSPRLVYVDEVLNLHEGFITDSLSLTRPHRLSIHRDRFLPGSEVWRVVKEQRRREYYENARAEGILRSRLGQGGKAGSYEDALRAYKRELQESLELADLAMRREHRDSSQADRYVTQVDIAPSGSCNTAR